MGRHICLVLSLVLTGLSIDEYFSFSNSTGAASLLTDALGSTLALTDSTGAVFSTSVYEPFGRQPVGIGHSPSSPLITIPFEFTGREDDDGTVYYYRARYYNTYLQRFLSQDPLDLPGIDSSLYTYVDNDPVSAIDPSGWTALNFDPANQILTVDPEQPGSSTYTLPAVSGRPGCTGGCGTNTPNAGPIPGGEYFLLTKEISQPNFLRTLLRNNPINGADWGGWRAPLHPERGTETFGRGGFFLHEGYLSLGSAGCINVGGGLFGNTQSRQLLKDLRADPDGLVPLRVK